LSPESKPKIVVIAGPTASGKTSVGIALARRFNGEIVSADSIQIYKHMDIGSAKPTREERAAARHHLLDIRLPDENYSAGDYVRDARAAVDSILGRGRLPLVVGGTGLYIKVLLGGVAEMPASDESIRRALSADEFRRPGILYERLEQLDEEAAAGIPPQNIARIIRALEVIITTGKKFSDLRRTHLFKDRPYDCLFFCLDPGREVLYERIDNRVDSMIKGGLLEEVEELFRRGYHSDLKPMQSLGYRHAGMVAAGEADLEEAVRLMKRDTRHYAKRQLTWFRSEPGALWFGPDDQHGMKLILENFLGR
jgi:tRNA dimethylallyltransferase